MRFAKSKSLLDIAKVNHLSFLAQIVQIGTVPPLISLRLESAGTPPWVIGVVAASPWIAILILGRFVPRILQRLGFVRSNWAAFGVSLLTALGMAITVQPGVLFVLNFLFGGGLILRWITCDTWIVAIAPPELRGRALGVHETLMGCGIAAGPLVVGLAGSTGATPLLACAGLLALSVLPLFSLISADGHPPTPPNSGLLQFTAIIPTAMTAGCLAGFAETSAVSFLPVMGMRGDFAVGAAAVLAGFGLGGMLLQVPLGWLADGAGYRRAQAITAFVVFSGASMLPSFASTQSLLLLLLFFWGGAIGGMNTLAVIEAGHRVADAQISTAMMSVAMAYTAGSILGPVLTGAAGSKFPALGLPLATGLASVAFLILWWVNPTTKVHGCIARRLTHDRRYPE